MSPHIDLADAFERIAAIERIAVPETKATRSYLNANLSVYPHWLNFLGSVTTPVPDSGTELVKIEFTIRMRLIVGKMTEGYDGEIEGRLVEWIPATIEAFRARTQLQSSSFPRPPDDLDPRGIELRTIRGLAAFQDTTALYVGTEFDLIVPFIRRIDPVN